MNSAAPIRKRDSEATSAAILQAAAELFSERGFDQTSTRDIADRAGANVALINRYFGSKRGLFEAAILPHLTINGFLEDGLAGFGERVTGHYFEDCQDKVIDPVLASLRSAGSEEIATLIGTASRTQVVDALAARMKGRDRKVRATQVVSLLLGIDMTVRVFKAAPPDASTRAKLRRAYARDIQKLIDG